MPLDLEQLRGRIQPWLEPVSSDAPTGKSAKFEPAYESIIKEIAKLESPLVAKLDWERVVTLGRELLKSTSKDVLIACYTAHGLFVTQGLDGLLEGTTALAELMDRYWPTMFPERMRARINALSWFVEQSTRALNGFDAGANREAVDSLGVAVQRLTDVSRDKLGGQTPAFGTLLDSVQQLQRAVEPLPVAVKAVGALPSPPAPAASDAVLTQPSDAKDFLGRQGNALVSAAYILRQANATDPVPYRILRVGIWLNVNEPPATGANGRTSIMPFPPDRRKQFEQLSANSKWPLLLDESESSIAKNRFNLDLQYFSFQALSALGSAYQPARLAMLTEVAAYLRRTPSAIDLVSSDGSPLADPATRKWIEAEVIERGASASTGSKSLPSEEESALVTQAFQLFLEGRSQDALKLLGTNDSGGRRTHFRLRLQLAQMCATRGQPSLASSLFFGLQRDCFQHRLDLWEPSLAIECLEGFLRIVRSRSKEAIFRDFSEQYQVLCRLDPSAVLRIEA